MKEDYDGAEPAASSISVSNLARLAALARPEEAERLRQCVLLLMQNGKEPAPIPGQSGPVFRSMLLWEQHTTCMYGFEHICEYLNNMLLAGAAPHLATGTGAACCDSA